MRVCTHMHAHVCVHTLVHAQTHTHTMKPLLFAVYEIMCLHSGGNLSL